MNHCLSESSPLPIVSPKVPPCWIIGSPKVTYSLSSLQKAPLSIVSPKMEPCWLTAYSKSIPSSIKQQRSMCRNFRTWEQQKEHTSIQIKQFDFELYTFQFSSRIHVVLSSTFFSFFGSEVWFLILRCDISFDDNLRLNLSFFVLGGFSDMAGLACAHHPAFYLWTSTSLPVAPLLFKKMPSEQLWLGIKIFSIGLVDYSTVGFS